MRSQEKLRKPGNVAAGAELFLPGALLVTIGAQLFASFMLVDLRFATFLQ
jgi:hypothetical protein